MSQNSAILNRPKTENQTSMMCGLIDQTKKKRASATDKHGGEMCDKEGRKAFTYKVEIMSKVI